MNVTRHILTFMLATCVGDVVAGEPADWSLRDCIEYALENNIKVKTSKLSVLSTAEDVNESKSQMFPSLAFSTTHQGSYMPFPEKDGAGSTNHFAYTGDYGLNASWTIFDGNKRKNNIDQKKLSGEQAELSLAEVSFGQQIALLPHNAGHNNWSSLGYNHACHRTR